LAKGNGFICLNCCGVFPGSPSEVKDFHNCTDCNSENILTLTSKGSIILEKSIEPIQKLQKIGLKGGNLQNLIKLV